MDNILCVIYTLPPRHFSVSVTYLECNLTVLRKTIMSKNVRNNSSTVELHLPGLNGTMSHPDMQKIQIIYFSLKTGYIGSVKFGCYYLQCLPAFKPFNHA